jgi:hypothetical protein
VFVRILSLLSIAAIAGAIALVVFGEDDNVPIVAVLVLLAFGTTTLLAIRAGYLKARSIVSDAKTFARGRVQHARLVSIGDPKGIFWPRSPLHLEFEGEDGKVHSFQRDVPVPFFVGWGYRLGRRFNLPLLRSIDLTKLMAFELRREGMKVAVGRGGAPRAPV